MPGSQDLRRRIKSISGTRKVTRAMQLVSASKMRRSQLALQASKRYTELLVELSSKVGDLRHPLLAPYPRAEKIAVLVVSTNRGLVGSFNTNLMRLAGRLAQEFPGTKIDFITLGRKGKETLLRQQQHIIADFPKADTEMSSETLYPLARLVTDTYRSGQYRAMYVVYNHFISTLRQEPEKTILFPITLAPITSGGQDKPFAGTYTFEPNPTQVADSLIPRLIETKLLLSWLESDASEHSARMLMMKNATDAAGDLIADLTLTLNQLRQNKITTELSEITAGKIALEKR